MQNKIKIVISACLLGKTVRYDGGHKFDRHLAATLGQYAEWVPVCPEVGAGFSVPREAMQLVRETLPPRLVTIESRQNRTEEFMRWIEKKIPQLEQEKICGFIFKARSPSCGVHDTPLYSTTGEVVGAGSGLFAEAVKRRFSSLPIEDEERLRDSSIREIFLERALHSSGTKT